MIEQWKEIPGYKGFYEISDLGRVRSYKSRGIGSANDARVPPRILSQHLNSNGYVRVGLDGKHMLVHRLVMITFVGKSKLEVNHKNAIRTDNRLANLEYMSTKDNRNYSYHALGIKRKSSSNGEKNHLAKLTEYQVIEIRAKYKSGGLVADLSSEYCISRSTCVRLLNGKTWGHVPGAIKLHNPRNGKANRRC
jgi:hypothetical protein